MSIQTPKAIPQQTMEMISIVTDPYHDRNLRLQGYPDGLSTISTIVRNAVQTTITCPFTLAANETWDFRIFTTPYHYKSMSQKEIKLSAVTLNSFSWDSTAASYQIGPVNVEYRKYTAGVISQFILVPLGQQMPPSQNDAQVRTINLAFELHNTTAELYKSGSITSYRLPVSQQRTDNILTNLTGGEKTTPSATFIGAHPATLAQANQMPNSRTWEASKGIYSVSLPNPNNTYSCEMWQNTIINLGTPNPTFQSGIYFLTPGLVGETADVTWSPLSCTGMISSIFTDKNQTFTLDFRQCLELTPLANNSALLAFSTTSPQIDHLFLKMYKRMFNSIEPGVPVGFNSAGEWFRRMVGLAKEHLPSLINLLPPQYRGPATAALPAVNLIADKVISKLQHQPQVVAKKKPAQKLKRSGVPSLQAKAQFQRFMSSRALSQRPTRKLKKSK